MLWSQNILNFFQSLSINVKLPSGVVVLNPYANAESYAHCEKFYNQFYNDKSQRNLIIGINPGRFGAGLTGIPFTDPIKLEQECGIKNNLKKKAELSSDFIYQVIDSIGGPHKFYKQFYFGSVSPLGFVKDDKNLNYYDIPKLQEVLMPFIKSCLHQQMEFGIKRDKCFVLGEGKNFAFMEKLNLELKCFNEVIPLSHPRFIMQYKRKKLKDYISAYQNVLRA